MNNQHTYWLWGNKSKQLW